MSEKYWIKGSRNHAYWDDTATVVVAGPFNKRGVAEIFMTKYADLITGNPMLNEFKVTNLYISNNGRDYDD